MIAPVRVSRVEPEALPHRVRVTVGADHVYGPGSAVRLTAILNPPLSERVREWGYLVGIALVAVAIGAGALWLGERAGMGVQGSDGHALEIVQEMGEDAPMSMDD